jgi:signal-transduction protein with cAMP-binding, CBS, and nucleotidyltransferase domain
MTTEPCTVDEELTLADAQDRMQANNIRHLLVSKNGRMSGLISSRDVAFAVSLEQIDAKKLLVRDAMSRKVYTCQKGDDLAEVAWQMEGHRFGCAVVLEEDTVVGVFTTTDALRALRQAIVGHEVPAAVEPTHKPTIGETRDVVAHHTSVSRTLASHHAGPTAGQGLFGKSGV